MKAMQYKSAAGGLDKNLRLNDALPLPKTAKALAADHTLVKVAYATLNPIDYKLPETPLLGSLLPGPGIPALDYSGTVVESKLAHLKPGTPVFGASAPPAFGTLAEYVVVGKQAVAPVPDGVSLQDAACLGVAALAAYQSLAPFVKRGDRVLIVGGSGGVGTFAIQFAKALGCTVTTTCSGPNVDLCARLGADDVIDYRTDDVAARLRRGGARFDHVFDAVMPDAALYWQCHHFLKPDAKYATVAGEVSFGSVATLLSIFLWPAWLGGGQRKFAFVSADGNPTDFAKMAALVKEGKVKPVIEEVFELGDAGKGYERLKSHRARGKIVVKVAA